MRADGLGERLRARRAEIEQTALTRVLSVSQDPDPSAPDYAEGLRLAVSVAVEYGITGIESGEGRPPPVPAPLLAQARRAARSGVGLDTVLRRYVAGNALLGDFLVQEVGEDCPPAELKRLLGSLTQLLERLLAGVSAAYSEETESARGGAESRRGRIVERLLDGELLETSELGYDLAAHHLGLLAAGRGAAEAVRALARGLDARALTVRRQGELLWAWLGRRRPIDPQDVRRRVASTWPSHIALALGEPGEALIGWRLTHQQARAALPIAQRSPSHPVRYADVALLASIIQDDLLATSLQALYIEPLEAERDGGDALRETLRAYFACERNASSAAAVLGVSRNTVSSRLRTVEQRLARRLDACGLDLEAALRLDSARSGCVLRVWEGNQTVHLS